MVRWSESGCVWRRSAEATRGSGNVEAKEDAEFVRPRNRNQSMSKRPHALLVSSAYSRSPLISFLSASSCAARCSFQPPISAKKARRLQPPKESHLVRGARMAPYPSLRPFAYSPSLKQATTLVHTQSRGTRVQQVTTAPARGGAIVGLRKVTLTVGQNSPSDVPSPLTLSTTYTPHGRQKWPVKL